MANLFLVYGSEQFLIEQAVRELRQKYVDPAMESFALEIIPEQEKNIYRWIDSVQMTSFAPSRLIISYDPFFLRSNKKTDEDEEQEGTAGLADKEEKLLLAALENLPAGLAVVFVLSKAPDKRKKIFKFFQKQAQIQEFEAFKPYETYKAAAWLIEYWRAKNVALDKRTADFLIEVCGVSRGVLINEITKILVYNGGKNKITLQDAQAMVSQGELNIYYLGEAMQHKDMPRIMGLAAEILAAEKSPQKFYGYVIAQIRKLLQIKELHSAGRNKNEIAQLLGQHPFTIEKILEHMPKYTLSKLKNAYYELQNADYLYKSGRMNATDALLCALAGLA